mmetsp:Transcript_64905/g.115492  ORF Transcript_64905/g.115492 Transcript_64905/m.115492 type:complete len:325 (-) Transcript_64905:419-1393(-)
MDGKYYGRRIVEEPAQSVKHQSAAAAALDAADGVMDGKYYGRQIVEEPVRRVMRPYPAGRQAAVARVVEQVHASTRSTSAAALDAADGVMDGKYYGQRIVEDRPMQRVHREYPVRALQEGVRVLTESGVRVVQQGAPTHRSAAAAALDAADGVMDGKFFGRQVVENSPVRKVMRHYPARAEPRREHAVKGLSHALDVADGARGAHYASPAAAALDAADGRMDGKLFGRDIVEHRPDNRVVRSYPVHVDAAGRQVGGTPGRPRDGTDGVVDGHYYGQDVDRRRYPVQRPAAHIHHEERPGRDRAYPVRRPNAADGRTSSRGRKVY